MLTISLSEFSISNFKFQISLASILDGTGCVDLDAFLATNATRHLAVYAAGNDRLFGPGVATRLVKAPALAPTTGLGVTDPPSGSRDWRNGDGDTTATTPCSRPAQPRTCSPSERCGTCIIVSNSLAYLGYASNAVVTLAPFSGGGPTDDGRIKPEIVAVGQSNSVIRSFGIATPANNATNGHNIVP